MTDLKIGVIGLAGKWSTQVLADEIEKLTGFRLIIELNQVAADLEQRRLIYQDHNLCELDALIIKKAGASYHPGMIDQLEMLRLAENQGVRIFSAPEKIIRLVDRLSCTMTLSSANIPMPPTFATEQIEQAHQAINRFQHAVLKPLFSTKAKGMELVKANQHKLRDTLAAYKKQHGFFYIQQKLDLPGQDLGLMFIGGEYQGAYARVKGQKSWNTSTANGGKYAAAQASPEMIDIAQRAQALFDLDITTVDMADTAHGPVCFEVSAFGGFKGAQQGLGLNIAERYIHYIIHQLSDQT